MNDTVKKLADVKRPQGVAQASSLYDRLKAIRPDLSMKEFVRECQKRKIILEQ